MRVAAALLLVAQVVLLIWSSIVHSPTPDEIPHIISGVSIWQTGDCTLFRVNPPLFRIIASIPATMLKQDWPTLLADPSDYSRPEMGLGREFIDSHGSEAIRILIACRWICIPFATFGGIVCFLWATRLYGETAGLAACALWSFSPLVLGFGAIVTPDVASAAFGGFALYRFTLWLEHSNPFQALWSGISIALALLIKSTWIVGPPIMVVIWIGNCISKNRNKEISGPHRFGQVVVMITVAWLVFVAGYGGSGLFRALGDYEFVSSTLGGQYSQTIGKGNRFRGGFFKHIPVPLPAAFVEGVDQQKRSMRNGAQPAYMLGTMRSNGGWYGYYALSLCVKCTLGAIALFIVVTIYRAAKIARWPTISEGVVLFPAITIFVLLSCNTGLNKHSRYLLPIYPMLIVWISQSVNLPMALFGLKFKFVSAILVLSSIASSLAVFPHSMSYFNELVGGPRNGRFFLINSNIDWGQDLFFLRDKLQKLGWSRIGMVYWGTYDARIAGIDFFVPPVHPSLQNGELQRLQPGKYAISISQLQGYGHAAPDGAGGLTPSIHGGYTYFQEFQSVDSVGYSMLLFDLSTEDIENSKTWGNQELKLRTK
ncbi:MAG: glycosyltransferase family 39 protein [Pirellula sp.]